MLETLWQDVRYAARSLRRTPGFTFTAVVTLALGIGASAAVFNVVDAVLLRSLPYRDAERLHVIHEVIPAIAATRPLVPVSALHFREWRANSRSFEDMMLLAPASYTLTGAGEPRRIDGARVSPSFFSTLGVGAALGRTFVDGEDVAGRDAVVVLGHELWVTQFGADPNIVGRAIMLDGAPATVVGVLSAGFALPRLSQFYAIELDLQRPQLLRPFVATEPELSPLGAFNNAAVGRVKSGVTAAQALAELDAIQAELARRAPERADFRAALVPMADQVTGRFRAPLQLVLAAVALVLLVACINITNLLLTRSGRRQRELAIRRATGAPPARLVREAMIESLVLAAAAGLVGLGLQAALVSGLHAYAPAGLPRLEEISFDTRSLLTSFVTTLLTGLVIGLLPSWHSLRSSTPAELLRSSGSASAGGRGASRLRACLVGLEVAASVVCLVAGALLVTSFLKVMTVDRGFDAGRVLTMNLVLPAARYGTAEEGLRFLDTLVDRVRATPGVRFAGITDRLPLTVPSNSAVMVEGVNLPRQQRPLATVRMAGEDYLAAMGIELRDGRLIAKADAGRRVALMSVTGARQLWPGQDALGKRFRIGPDDSPFFEVVGVVADVRSVSLSANPPLSIYVPASENFYNVASLAVRTDTDAAGVASTLRTIVRDLDPDLAVPVVRPMDDLVEASVAQRRFQMNLVTLLAATGLLLVCLGIYGVVSQAVTQRTAEFGIRMALGANTRRILRTVLAQGLLPVGVGLTVGLVAALGVGRLLGSLLFEVAPTDMLPLAAASGLLLGVAVIASLIPAWRASRIDPTTALRVD